VGPGGDSVRRTGMNRTLCIVVAILSACLASACGGVASPGPVGHSPFDLPTATGTIGTYLRDCLGPDTGLVLGSDAPVRIDSASVTAIVRCEPDADHNAVRVSEAMGDVGPLLGALATRRPVSSSSTGKQTVFIVFKAGRHHEPSDCNRHPRKRRGCGQVPSHRNDTQRLVVASRPCRSDSYRGPWRWDAGLGARESPVPAPLAASPPRAAA